MNNTAVFEAESTVSKWDDDYYTPISVRLYDQAVVDMLAAMKVPANATVLDAGCGPGVHSIRAANYGCQVRAIDISETMLSHARQRVGEAGFGDRVSFEQQDLTKLTLPDASIDYAFSWGVIIHIPDAESAFRELARVIRPGGKLALYLTNQTSLDSKLLRLAYKFAGNAPKVTQAPLGEFTVYRMDGNDLCVWQFNTDSVARLLGTLGFKMISRRCGEFSEIQRRLPSVVRNPLLRLNNFAYANKWSASMAVANLTIFEKSV